MKTKTKYTFRDALNAHFFHFGIANPVGYLARRKNTSDANIYLIIGRAEKGVGGRGCSEYAATWLIYEADNIIPEEIEYRDNPVRKWLKPKIEKYIKNGGKK